MSANANANCIRMCKQNSNQTRERYFCVCQCVCHEYCVISIKTCALSWSFHHATRSSKIAKEEMEKLIELVREYPCLYDQSCRNTKMLSYSTSWFVDTVCIQSWSQKGITLHLRLWT